MKKLAIFFLALAMVCAIGEMAVAVTLPAPSLTLTTDGITVSLSWTASAGADGYKLYYAPPDISYIGDIDMGSQTSVSFDLWSGAAFYVAVKAYNSAGSSDYSNIEYFVIGEPPEPIGYDGDWSGTTNQGYGVSFTVSNNKITTFKIKYKVSGYYCSATTEKTTTGSFPISGNSFSISGSSYNSQSYKYDYYKYTGTFINSGTWSGTWADENSHCGGSDSGTWEAL